MNVSLLSVQRSKKALVWYVAGAGALMNITTVCGAGEVRFNRDIRPLMSDTCFHCHGFDAKSREAKLRLDIREEALKPAKSGEIPIVPGKPEESEIIRRIFSDDKDDVMPAAKAHKEFTTAQKELFRRWVAEGAKYEAHWAYTPLSRPPLPAENKNPVDAFIRAQLATKGIQPSAEAPKERLLRRLSLDLTGLPPTIEEVAAFISDNTPGAYERQVSRLLASPHFGERMAVWWLDIARFADTVGFHGDQNQRIFPYRDYVIGAFNSNKRFDQFTVEQLAGDLLPNPTSEQLVATGYNRLTMMTREGGAQPNEYLAKYGAERVRAVSAAWFGSTFGCAECHDHKFDPIKTADFYSLQAFFADIKQWGVYSDYGYTKNNDLAGFTNDYPFPPEIEVASPYLQAREKSAQAALDAHLLEFQKRLQTGPDTAFSHWRAGMREFLAANPNGWRVPPLNVQLFEGGKPKPDADLFIAAGQIIQFSGKPPANAEYRISLTPGPINVAAVRVELCAGDPALTAPPGGPKRQNMKFSAAVRGADGKERKVGFYDATATASEPRYENGAEVLGIKGGWSLPTKPGGEMAEAVWLLDSPVKLAAGEKLLVTLGGDAARPVRVSVSPLAALDPLQSAGPQLREALLTAEGAATPAQQKLLADAFLVSTQSDQAVFSIAKNLAANVRANRGGRAWSLITQAVEPLTVRILPRGNWQDQTGAVVLPSTPSFLPGRLESTPQKRLTRLDLAKWLCSKENPITARAVINRLWQQYFGIGLSAALDDLGSQGELPVHPELLDWLASEFRDSGWDFKHMISLIVTSATYRQSSSLRPELREADPANRLLASQNPRRLDAEFVRDNALFIAGRLNLDGIGGPSAFPYQPARYYEALQFPDRTYKPSADDEQWRRGVYTHWQRAYLHPMLINFDAPARDECAAMRTVSNTPQQALTLLNDPTFVEAARLFAARLLGSAATDDARLASAFQLAMARPIREVEKSSLKEFLAGQRDYYREHTADAAKLAAAGTAAPSPGDPVELAAWTSLCRVVLNSQEVITRY